MVAVHLGMEWKRDLNLLKICYPRRRSVGLPVHMWLWVCVSALWKENRWCYQHHSWYRDSSWQPLVVLRNLGQRSRSHDYEKRHGRTVASEACCCCCRRWTARVCSCLFLSLQTMCILFVILCRPSGYTLTACQMSTSDVTRHWRPTVQGPLMSARRSRPYYNWQIQSTGAARANDCW